ncbi:MAG: hypothetical protein IJQ42_05355, partial [Oscillospiraceae bacterium]|nr:hypothetical protein [Oscillospiraceae bacterium]
MRGPFPPIHHRKIREYSKYSRIFLYRLGEKCLAQNCAAPQTERFLCQARRLAQEYWICIPSTGNDAWHEKILFAA